MSTSRWSYDPFCLSFHCNRRGHHVAKDWRHVTVRLDVASHCVLTSCYPTSRQCFTLPSYHHGTFVLPLQSFHPCLTSLWWASMPTGALTIFCIWFACIIQCLHHFAWFWKLVSVFTLFCMLLSVLTIFYVLWLVFELLDMDLEILHRCVCFTLFLPHFMCIHSYLSLCHLWGLRHP